MSGRYGAHGEYQDTGLDWLGRIPKSWELRRLGSYFQERRTKVSDADYSALSVTMQGIVPQLETAAKTDDGDNRKLVRAGDFVINSRSDRKGSSGVSPYDGSVSLISIVLKPINLHPPFVHHLLRSTAFQEEFYRFGKGIVADLWSTNYSAMKNIGIPVMRLSEQAQIAKFLDYETLRIDALMEKQQQLIALLKEKRQAVISHAVTQGLNPDAPMRDSGVEWLGEVPAHWRILNLSRVVRTFIDYRGRTPEKTDDGRPLVTAGAVRNGIVDLARAPQFVSEETYQFLRQRGIPEEGDILFTSEAPLGEVAIVRDTEIACAQRIIMFKLERERVTPEFLWLYMRSQAGGDAIQTKASGSTAEGIRADRLRRCRVLTPPLEEQANIVAHVARETHGFDAVLELVSEQKSLLQERRTALISAAVTGKIDVRGWKAPKTAVEAETA